MFNLEHMKSLVEATIQNAPEKEEPEVSMTMVESIDIPGEFGEDMCNYIDVAITESVADIYAYSADASSMLIESAISAATGNEEVAQKFNLLTEATAAGMRERVVAALKKIAAFFRGLATKIATYFTQFFNMTKGWLKINKARVTEKAKEQATVKAKPWSMDKLKKLENCCDTSSFTAVDNILSASQSADSLEKVVVSSLLSIDCESVKGIPECLNKFMGVNSEAQDVSAMDLLAVVEGAGQLGKNLAKQAKELSTKAHAEAKKWSGSAKEAQSEDLATKAKLTATGWSYAQKTFTKYATSVQQITKAAAKNSMSALTKFIGGKEKAEAK